MRPTIKHAVAVLGVMTLYAFVPQQGSRVVPVPVLAAAGQVGGAPAVVARPDRYATTVNRPLIIAAPGVLRNDGGDVLVATIPGAPTLVPPWPAHGDVTPSVDGSFTYTPDPGFRGTDVFTYTATDRSGQSATATVTIIVNALPRANGDAYTVTAETTLTVAAENGVLANDTDADGQILTVTRVALWQQFMWENTGQATTAGGCAETASFAGRCLTPPQNTEDATEAPWPAVLPRGGVLTFVGAGRPGTTFTVSATGSLTLIEDTSAPEAPQPGAFCDDPLTCLGHPQWSAGSFPLPRGTTTFDVDVTGAPGADLAFFRVAPIALIALPTNGTVTLNADGSFEYTPNAGFAGTDTFTYRANDGISQSALATVTITVNLPPVAVDDSYTIAEDVPLTVTAPGLLSNDSDPDAGVDTILTAAVVTPPTRGALALTLDGSFTYTPAGNFNGTDSFTYQARDRADEEAASSNIATVTINVTPVNDPPVAANDVYTIPEDSTLNVAAPGVLFNDTDVENSKLLAVLTVSPEYGTVTLSSDGSFIYRPPVNFNGTDTFNYRAREEASPAVGDGARVTIRIRAVNDRPVAGNDDYSVDEDSLLTVPAPGVLANDTDVEGDALEPVITLAPTKGMLTLNADHSFNYKPDPNFHGVDRFRYRARETLTGLTSTVAVVTITVRPVNDAPSARPDSYTTDVGAPLVIAAPGVLRNDSDIEGQALGTSVAAAPLNGVLTLNADGSFAYLPNAAFRGEDSFTYRATDAGGAASTATVRIGVNAPPVAAGDSYSTMRDTPLAVNAAAGVLANDSDADGQSLTVTEPGTWQQFMWASLGDAAQVGGCAPQAQFDGQCTAAPQRTVLATDPPWTSILPHGGLLTFVGAGLPGTQFVAYAADASGLPISPIGSTPTPSNPDLSGNTLCDDPAVCLADGTQWSRGTFPLASGTHTFAVDVTGAPGADLAFFRVSPVALVTAPQHGSLRFNADGSFSYTPDAGFSGFDTFSYQASDGVSSSPVADVTIVVRSPTTTTLAPPPATSTYGQSVTLTATVSGTGAAGSVEFLDGAASLGSAPLMGGSAALATNAIGAGTRSITAVYRPTNAFASSTSAAATMTVAKASTTSTLLVSPSSVAYSDVVTFETTLTVVPGGDLPAGAAAFRIGTQTVGIGYFGAPVNGVSRARWSGPLLETVAGQLRPAAKTVTAIYTQISPNYTVTSRSGSMAINQEGSITTAYQGDADVTCTTTCSAVPVRLAAKITETDTTPGDLTKATLTFVDRASGIPIATVPVAADGTARYTGWTVTLGTVTSRTIRIGMAVGNYYVRNNTAEDATVVVHR